MKKCIFLFISLCTFHFIFSQQMRMTWGEELKLKKGNFNLQVLQADKTGIFLKESHYAYKTYFVFAASFRESATLIRLDNNLMEVYRTNFNDQLKGKEYESFFFLKNKLFILASDYNKKDKTLELFAGEVNKETGKLSGDLKQITSWKKQEKKDEINFRATYNADSSKMVIISMVRGNEKNSYEVFQIDDKLNPVGNTIILSNEFDPQTFQLEDIVYTKNENIVLVGREYEYQEGKKKKVRYLDFKNYIIRIYDNKVGEVKEINTTINGKWLISSKIKQLQNNELMLAAFYSNEKRGAETNGMFVQRINSQTGAVVATYDKTINTSLITSPGDENHPVDGNESQDEKNEREKLQKIQNEEDGFSRFMRFRDFVFAPDSGVVIIAEEYYTYQYNTSSYTPGRVGQGGSWRTTTYQVYECGNILMSKVNAAGNIGWLNVLPKFQREVYDIGRGGGFGTTISVSSSFFLSANNWPLYSSIGLIQSNNTLNIIFNDHKENAGVLQLGQKISRISYFGRSNCFAVSLNLRDGTCKRKFLFSNEDIPTAMPRLGSVFNKDFYIIGKQDKVFGKTKITVGRLNIK
jgi:hypothetical protein